MRNLKGYVHSVRLILGDRQDIKASLQFLHLQKMDHFTSSGWTFSLDVSQNWNRKTQNSQDAPCFKTSKRYITACAISVRARVSPHATSSDTDPGQMQNHWKAVKTMRSKKNVNFTYKTIPVLIMIIFGADSDSVCKPDHGVLLSNRNVLLFILLFYHTCLYVLLQYVLLDLV